MLTRVLLLIIAIAHGVQPKAAANMAPGATALGKPAARWHLDRRAAILQKYPEVSELIGQERSTLPLLVACNAAQVGFAVTSSQLPDVVQIPLAIFVGGTLSLWQFALLHDVKHGVAALPPNVRPNDVLFYGSLPSLFGYYLYLRYGHLTHHKDFGRFSLKDLFDSERLDFEDGDALFVAHRQQMPQDEAHTRVGFVGKEAVGGLGVSISRTLYSLLWWDPKRVAGQREGAGEEDEDEFLGALGGNRRLAAQSLVPAWNAAVFSFSMCFERAALVFGGGVVPAVVGRNYFFNGKPDAFHTTCTSYARVSLGLAVALGLAAGPCALAWLFWAEVGWQCECSTHRPAFTHQATSRALS